MKKKLILLVMLIPTLAFSQYTFWSNDFSNSSDWLMKNPEFATNESWKITNEEFISLNNVLVEATNFPNSNNSYNSYSYFITDMPYNGEDSFLLYNNTPIKNFNYQNVQLSFYQKFGLGNELTGNIFTSIIICDKNFKKQKKIQLIKNIANDDPNEIKMVELVTLNIDTCIEGLDEFRIVFMVSDFGIGRAWLIDDVLLTTTTEHKNVEVLSIFTLGKLPIVHGNGHKIKTEIQNTGNVTSNFTSTLTITGANSFTSTKTITALKPNDYTTVTFDAFNPAQLGANNVEVLVSADSKLLGTKNCYNEVTSSVMSYTDTAKTIYNKYGNNMGGNGMFLARYYLSNSKNILGVNIGIVSPNTDNTIANDAIGATVYAVLLDKDNKQIDRSDDYVIQANDLGKIHKFKLQLQPRLTNTAFYVGIAVVTKNVHRLLASVKGTERIRDSAFYNSNDLIPSYVAQPPMSDNYMIEAEIGDVDPQICIITNESATGKNLIAWQKQQSNTINRYNIYRETNFENEFVKIGSVPYNEVSVFVDKGVNPRKQQYKYQITAVDTYKIESAPSNWHKPLFLQYVQTQNGFNLRWDLYETSNSSSLFKGYYLYRGTDSLNMVKYDSFPAKQTSFTDLDPNSLKVRMYYQIFGILYNACAPLSYLKASSSGPFLQSVSNLEDNRLRFNEDAIHSNNLANSFMVYPNPITNNFSLQFNSDSQTSGTIEIINTIGTTIKKVEIQNIAIGFNKFNFNNTEIGLESGLYYLKLNTSNAIATQIITIMK